LLNEINSIGEGWLTVYHPLGGFNFEEYGNLKMFDDCGPNRYIKELSNLPMNQGLYVTPRIKHIIGLNKTGYNHIKPFNIKDEQDGNDYYYLVVLCCLANPSKLRVPSAFAGKINKYFSLIF
jgi:hypothetical protein